MSYDWHEEQRKKANDRQRKLTNQAREMSTGELLYSLSWESELGDHFAEIGQSNNCGEKCTVIRMELARRGAL